MNQFCYIMFEHIISHIIALIHGVFIYYVSLHSCRDRNARAGDRRVPARSHRRRRPSGHPRQTPKHPLNLILDQMSIYVLYVHKSIFVYMFAQLLILMHYPSLTQNNHFQRSMLAYVSRFNSCLAMLSFGRSREVARSPPLASYS